MRWFFYCVEVLNNTPKDTLTGVAVISLHFVFWRYVRKAEIA
jgi:hypothetical protein